MKRLIIILSFTYSLLNAQSITYSNFSNIVHSIIDYPVVIPIQSSGNGTGITQIGIGCTTTMTMTCTNNAHFYTDAAATLNESQSVTVNVYNPVSEPYGKIFYIKCPSGQSNIYLSNKTLGALLIQNTTPQDTINTPYLTYDVKYCNNIKTIFYGGGKHILQGDVTPLNSLETLWGGSFYNIYGNMDANDKLSNIGLHGSGNYQAINSKLYINLSNKPNISYLEIGDAGIVGISGIYGHAYLSGHIQPNNKLTVCVSYTPSSTYSFTPDSFPKLVYIESKTGSTNVNATMTLANNILRDTSCRFLNLYYTYMSTAVLDSTLHSLYINKDKGGLINTVYHQYFFSNPDNGVPTSAGYNWSALLQIYRTPNNPPWWNNPNGIILTQVSTPDTANYPVVDYQPINTSISANASTKFNCVGHGKTITYQWQVSTDGGTNYSNISNGGVYGGVTTVELQLGAVPIGYNGYKYRCKIVGVSATVYSSAATLTVT